MSNITILLNGMEGHRVTDDPAPSFSLLKNGAVRPGECALAVTSSDGIPVWESGWNPYVPHLRYAGENLRPRTLYSVHASLRHGDRIVAEADSTFETGFLGSSWNARWIAPEQERAVREAEVSFGELFAPNPAFFGGQDRLRPCREVSKTFRLEEQPIRARIYASAHGIYELKVNGLAASDSLFAPETSVYRKCLYYQTYDVAHLLRPGENEILLTLADGWWIGRIGITGESCQYGDRLECILQADIARPDGTVLTIGSDETFRGRRSRIDYADLFIGQREDFSRSEDEWTPCRAKDAGTETLTAQPLPQVGVWAEYGPEWLVSGKGELLADFGQCLAGAVDITVDAPRGREVTLDYCEVLDSDGSFLRNILGRNKDQRDVFVCGPGQTRFAPEFTYHGFRYVRVSGAERREVKKLNARAMGTRLQERGRFSCSDARINRLQENIRQSARSNMFSVPTDCPQREKAGWTGDAMAFTPTGSFNFRLDGFLGAWLANMRLEQTADGAVPVVVPNYPAQEVLQDGMGGQASSAWSDACVIVPWHLYVSFGDSRILRDNLPMMERWLAYVEARCLEKPADFESRTASERRWNDFLWNTGFHFGDWFIPSFMRRPDGVAAATDATKDVVASCFHAVALEAYVEILDALLKENTGDGSLARNRDRAAVRLGNVRTAVRESYVDDDGTVRGDLQGLYVVVLRSGALEGVLKDKAAARLAEIIASNGHRLDTGFVSTPHLLDVLVENGHADAAYRLLFQNEAPSWLYMVERGATTIWENWEAVRPDGTAMPSSFNHYALGSVGDFIYRRIGGIEAEAPGYGAIRFAPDIHCGLEWSDCSVETPYGAASCSWRWTGGECRVRLEVPRGCPASFETGAKRLPLSEGTNNFVLPISGTQGVRR